MTSRIKTADAAKVLGLAEQSVRLWLQQGAEFGTAIKLSSRWTYVITADKLAKYIGITPEQLYERMGK